MPRHSLGGLILGIPANAFCSIPPAVETEDGYCI